MPHVGPHLPDTDIKTPLMVEGWLRNAIAGEHLEYWRGSLADALGDNGRMLKERLRIDELRKYMAALEKDGVVLLVQKRLGADDYSYLAVKR